MTRRHMMSKVLPRIPNRARRGCGNNGNPLNGGIPATATMAFGECRLSALKMASRFPLHVDVFDNAVMSFTPTDKTIKSASFAGNFGSSLRSTLPDPAPMLPYAAQSTRQRNAWDRCCAVWPTRAFVRFDAPTPEMIESPIATRLNGLPLPEDP